MSKQSLKKIDPKVLTLESGNEALTDGRTFKRFGGYNIIPRRFFFFFFFFVAGYKIRNDKVIFESSVFYIICNMLHAHDYLIIRYPVKTEETPI